MLNPDRDERQRIWSSWLDELSFRWLLDGEYERDNLAILIADVVTEAPAGDEEGDVRTDARLRGRRWSRWLEGASQLDPGRSEHRSELAAMLAGAVESVPRRGEWAGWISVRPRSPAVDRGDEALRADVVALRDVYSRSARMILSYLAREGLDLLRDGAAHCGDSVAAFAEMLKAGANKAAPFLPTLAARLGLPEDDVRAMVDGEYRAEVELALDPHVECRLDENCGGTDCPPAVAARKREAEKAGAWGSLILGVDGGGRRHFLAGESVSCGTTLELQTIASRSDDYGEYTVPMQQGTLVRYEAQLAREGSPATLHADVGGHEFISAAEAWMRFRWPQKDER